MSPTLTIWSSISVPKPFSLSLFPSSSTYFFSFRLLSLPSFFLIYSISYSVFLSPQYPQFLDSHFSGSPLSDVPATPPSPLIRHYTQCDGCLSSSPDPLAIKICHILHNMCRMWGVGGGTASPGSRGQGITKRWRGRETK